MQQLLITPLAPIHAQEAARLHIQGQPGTFLTSLGEDVLTVVYRALPQSRSGFGFAAIQFPDHSAVQAGEPSLVGYISATTGIGGLFLEMASQRLGELLPPLLHRYSQDPRLALHSMQTALYPFLMHQEDNSEPAAELLSIMVEPLLRSYGVGTLLMTAFLHECSRRALVSVTVTVDSANDGAHRFYQRHGFAAGRSIVLYGRQMVVFRRKLT